MRPMLSMAGVALLVTAGMLVALLQQGCEEASGTRALVVEPDFVDLSSSNSAARGKSQTFTVNDDSLDELSLPLQWEVSNPSLGRIAASAGNSATYIAYDVRGNNSIIARDQLSSEGLATIQQ